MKDEQKPEWSISEYSNVVVVNKKLQIVIPVLKEEIASEIVTACNSYHTLKQQNEEMKTMLKEAKEIALLQADLSKGNMQYKSMERMQVLSSRITDLLTKHKL